MISQADYWWVQPAVVALGICATIGAALHTIRANRAIARLKSTLDLIEDSESNEYYRELYQTFRKYRMDQEFRAKVLSPANDQEWEDRYKCLSYINHYELVAEGFKKGVLDEDFYREWMDYAVVREFTEAKELIDLSRNPTKPGDPGDKLAYCELELLVKRWMRRRPASTGTNSGSAADAPWYRRDPR